MKTLIDIIKQENEEHCISTIVEQLGFIEPKVIFFPNMHEKILFLLVKVNSDDMDAQANRDLILAAKLKSILNCKISILVESRLKDMHRNEILTNTALLSNVEDLQRLFKEDNLENVVFDDLDLNQIEQEEMTEGVLIADEIIKDKKMVKIKA